MTVIKKRNYDNVKDNNKTEIKQEFNKECGYNFTQTNLEYMFN